MKFRAVMNDQQSMKDFLDIILTISKLTKRCVMNLTSRTIDMIVNEDSENGAPAVWAEFSSSDNFSEYAIEGPNKDTQQIMLSLNPANLANAIGALRSGATYFKLKLTNVQYPCLTIEIETATNNSRKILHDIPVNVILKSDWNNFLLPKLPKTNVFLTLPSNRSIKNFIEKLKNITPMIKFYATSGGEMNVFAETELSTVTMKYKNLELRSCSSENQSSDNSSRASCVVECKKLSLLFSSLQISTTEWSCGILHDVLIHIEIDMRLGVSIHSVIPAVCV